MNWKVFCFVVLAILTVTVATYDFTLYSIPRRLYMSSHRGANPILPNLANEETLDNLTSTERAKAENYLRAADMVSDIDVSNDEWAQAMFNIYHGTKYYGVTSLDQAYFLVILSESEYYDVSLWQRKAYNPYNAEYSSNSLLNVLTFVLWIVFVYSVTRWHPNTGQTDSTSVSSSGFNIYPASLIFLGMENT